MIMWFSSVTDWDLLWIWFEKQFCPRLPNIILWSLCITLKERIWSILQNLLFPFVIHLIFSTTLHKLHILSFEIKALCYSLSPENSLKSISIKSHKACSQRPHCKCLALLILHKTFLIHKSHFIACILTLVIRELHLVKFSLIFL